MVGRASDVVLQIRSNKGNSGIIIKNIAVLFSKPHFI